MAIMVLVVGSACHGRGGGGRRGRAYAEVMAGIKDVGRVDSDCCHYNRGRATRRDTSSKGGIRRGSRGAGLCGWSFSLGGERVCYIKKRGFVISIRKEGPLDPVLFVCLHDAEFTLTRHLGCTACTNTVLLTNTEVCGVRLSTTALLLPTPPPHAASHLPNSPPTPTPTTTLPAIHHPLCAPVHLTHTLPCNVPPPQQRRRDAPSQSNPIKIPSPQPLASAPPPCPFADLLIYIPSYHRRADVSETQTRGSGVDLNRAPVRPCVQ